MAFDEIAQQPVSYETTFEFERRLAEYTGAKYAVTTSCCTHALELAFRWDEVKSAGCEKHTYLSVPMTLHKLGIDISWTDTDWRGEYNFAGTRIWDSARLLSEGMYRTGSIQCLSFGHTKPVDIGRGGAILTDDEDFATWATLMRGDGRDYTIHNWAEQKVFPIGEHFNMTLEQCSRGLILLGKHNPVPIKATYPDCSELTFVQPKDIDLERFKK